MTKRLLYLSLIYYLILAPDVDSAQPPTGLQGTLVKATLPIGMAYFSSQAVFNGKDSIYVIGGSNYNEKEYCTIFHYSISSDVINCVANIPEGSGQGTANLGKNGMIYFSSRQTGPFDLYEFDPITNNVRGVELPMTNTGFMYSAVTNSGSLILMDWIGQNTTVYEWYINATTYRTVGQLPFHKWGGSVHYLPESNKILIVGSYVESRTMALFDVETGQTEILPSFVWSTIAGADVVVNGELFRFGYVNGGTPNKFLWYDLAGQNQAIVEIQNVPHKALFSSYTGAYVQPLNRVYMFGGYINLEGTVNDIWYVDMAPLPDIPTVCDMMKVGEPCDAFGCSRCGFCWGNTSFYLQCDASTSQIIRDECDPGLWWNPLEKPKLLDIGGACDEWKNIPLEIRQKYRNDGNCVTPHCFWGQYEGDRCTNKYWYSNENGERTNLECGSNLVWDNVKQQCRLCKNVTDGCQC